MPGSPILSWYDWLIGSVLSVFFCLTLSLNALALHYTYTKLKKPSLKKVPHLLVGALSLSGLGIAVCLYPPYIASRFVGQLDYAAGLCEFIAFSILFFGTLTISMVVAMSLERLAAIVFPFCYKERMTFRKSVLALACLVLYSLAVAILPVVLQQVQLNISTGVCLYAVESHSANAQLVVFVICTHYVVSLVLMFAANSVVVYTVHQLDKNSLSDVYHDQKCKETPVKASSMSACLSFAKMVGIMSVCYAVCWTAILVSNQPIRHWILISRMAPLLEVLFLPLSFARLHIPTASYCCFLLMVHVYVALLMSETWVKNGYFWPVWLSIWDRVSIRLKTLLAPAGKMAFSTCL